MSDQLENTLSEGLSLDPILKDMPSYMKKDKMKLLLSRQQEELKNFTSNKNARAIDLVALSQTLKTTYEKFQEEYENIKQLKLSNEALAAKIEKTKKEAEMVKNIEEGLTGKYRELAETMKQDEAQLSKELKIYMDKKQNLIDSDQARYTDLRDKKYEQEEKRKFLLDKKEKVFTQVDEFLAAKDLLFKDKQQEIAELEEKFSHNMKTLLSTAEVDIPQANSAQVFTERYQKRYDKIVKSWQALNHQPEESAHLIESISSKIGKVRDLKAQTSKELFLLKEKLKDNMQKVMVFVSQNQDLADQIESEKGKASLFQKLIDDLKSKEKQAEDNPNP